MEDKEKEQRIEDHIAVYLQKMEDILQQEERVLNDLPLSECSVESNLGVIIVTSVIVFHPSVELIKAVISTHLKLEPKLGNAKEKLIICDKPKLDEEKLKYKSGRVREGDVANYEEYVENLERLVEAKEWPFEGFRVVRMEKYSGFAMCLKRGLEMLTVPYALVLQHDRILKQSFDVEELLLTFKRRPDKFKYIGLASNSSKGAEMRYRSFHIPVETHVQKTARDERTLVALPFWYDSTHIGEVKFYLERVFGWWVMPGTQYNKPFRLKNGDFPEDKLGCAMISYIKAEGMRVHDLFGCYLLDDDKTVYVRHIHGRKIGTGKQRALEHYVTVEETTLDE
jgi:hypothetical protein